MDKIKDQTFPTLSSIQLALATLCESTGERFVVHSQKPTAANATTIIFRCHRGRKYKSKADESIHESKRRKSRSQFVECGRRLKFRRIGPDAPWFWAPIQGQSAGDHNHPVYLEQKSPVERMRFIFNYHDQLKKNWNLGHTTRQQLDFLYSTQEPVAQYVTRQDIANFTAFLRQEELNGRSPIQWLYDEISIDQNFIYFDKRSADGRVEMLFITPRSALELYRQFPYVLLCDATYKTNRFNMPLFNIAGATSTKKTFQIAAVFINAERQENFAWVFGCLLQLMQQEAIAAPMVIISDRERALLNGLREYQLFDQIPHILCQWHVFINVLAQTKSDFPKATNKNGLVVRNEAFSQFLNEFKCLMYCELESDFKKQLYIFSFDGKYPSRAIQYVLQTWIIPWKENLISCYVNQVQHFGHTTTSIVESLHASIKRLLNGSKGDLATTFKVLKRHWQNEQFNIKNSFQYGVAKLPITSLDPMYQQIRLRITHIAMQYIQKEISTLDVDISKKPSSSCNPCTIKTVHGLPCRHDLWKTRHLQRQITMQEINKFWHWQESSLLQTNTQIQVLDPLVIRAKGRPKGALGLEDKSTKRSLSAFEYAEAEEKAEAKRLPKAAKKARRAKNTKKSDHDTEREPQVTQSPRGSQRFVEMLADITSDSESSCSNEGLLERQNNISIEQNIQIAININTEAEDRAEEEDEEEDEEDLVQFGLSEWRKK